MTKQNVPFFALAISYLGTITNLMTEAKSVIGVFAAGASLIASLYAIAIARNRLKSLRRAARNPFSASAPSARSARSAVRPHRPSRSPRSKKFPARATRASVLAVSLWLIPLLAFTACSHVATDRARADKALMQSNERLTEESRALTTAVVDSLNAAPQNPPTSLARRFALADQEIEGLPLHRIPATAALAGDTDAATDIEARFTEINSLRAHNSQLAQALRERDAALMELGTKYEAEKTNRSGVASKQPWSARLVWAD